jgi:flagellar motor switch protein FliM
MAERDVLNQSEVDALLSAIEEGEVAIPEETAAAPTRRVVAYDFKRPERVSRDQLRAIETLHEVFARNLQASLSGLLRSIVEVKVYTVDQLTYSEFITALPNPTCFVLLSCEPLEGNMILEMNPAAVFPIIDRRLGGGKGASLQPERPLTEIEWKLALGIVDRCIGLLHDVWANVEKITFKVTATESNPQLMPIMSSNEPVVLVTFELSIGEQKGFMNICLPVVTIEPIMDKIAAQTWFGRLSRGAATHGGVSVSDNLAHAEVSLLCTLAETSISIDELRGLRVGDYLTTVQPQDAPVIVSVEGKPKFIGQPCRYRDNLAVRILRRVSPDELPAPPD